MKRSSPRSTTTSRRRSAEFTIKRDHAAEWNALGTRDPHWAIRSDPGRQGSWDDDAFFASGRAEIDTTLTELGDRLDARDSALDFGCGLGRLTQALAKHYGSVTGVDIAQSMVDGARARNAFGDRVSYIVNTAGTLPLADASFDFAYSTMVLQHVPPKAAAVYIGELVRVLRPGGILVFSELSHRAPTLRNKVQRVVPPVALRLVRRARFGWAAAITMHGVPRATVIALIEQAGGEVVDARPDGAGQPVWVSYRYTVRRNATPGPPR